MLSSPIKARVYPYLKLNLAIYSECYSTGKFRFVLKLFLGTGCPISRLKPSPNNGRKQWLSLERFSARFSKNTKSKLTAFVGRSTGKQETNFTYAKAIKLPTAFLTD
jgi:hypothetical protein